VVLIIKKIIALAISAVLLGQNLAYGDEFMDSLSAQSAVLMWDGNMIYSKNSQQKLPMASTTKLMTALLTAESCDMDEEVLIETADCDTEGSSMYLRPGDTLSVKDLLKGLLLVSGNDAALALARYIGGSVEQFVVLMNEKAEALSMTSTSFANPHGLTDENHYSTAEDLALLMRACLDNKDLSGIISLKSCNIDGITLVNHNKLLYKLNGCTGGKTGFTEAAGRCLVSSCMRDGAELICVTLNAPDDWNDHISLYEKAFREYSLRDVTSGMRFLVPLIGGTESTAYLVPEYEKKIFVEKKSEVRVTPKLPWFIFGPIEKGKTICKAEISVDGKYAGEYPLVCS